MQSLTEFSSIDIQHSRQLFDGVGFANSSGFHQGRKVGKASQSLINGLVKDGKSEPLGLTQHLDGEARVAFILIAEALSRLVDQKTALNDHSPSQQRTMGMGQ